MDEYLSLPPWPWHAHWLGREPEGNTVAGQVSTRGTRQEPYDWLGTAT